MLKLAQWAYNLGRLNERRRIGYVLETSRRNSPYIHMGTNDQDTRKEAELIADNLVDQIIEDVVEPKHEEFKRYSILHPRKDREDV